MKIQLFLFTFCVAFFCNAQNIENAPMAFSSLSIIPDAVSSSLADTGVSYKADVYSQYSNSSKYIFFEKQRSIGLNYKPYLNKITKDVFLASIFYHHKLNRGSWATSFRFFSLGDTQLTKKYGQDILVLGVFRPREFAIDLSYNLKLSENYAMGITSKLLRANFNIPEKENISANALAFDISGYYLSRKILIKKYFFRHSLGFQISNLGAKVTYYNFGRQYFLPTNLKLGGSFFIDFNEYNKIVLSIGASKFLVPDIKNENLDFLSGIFQSFKNSNLKKINFNISNEYSFNDALFFRLGYYHQYKSFGNTKYICAGVGFKFYSNWQVDFSYTNSINNIQNPFTSSSQISLQYSFN